MDSVVESDMSVIAMSGMSGVSWRARHRWNRAARVSVTVVPEWTLKAIPAFPAISPKVTLPSEFAVCCSTWVPLHVQLRTLLAPSHCSPPST